MWLYSGVSWLSGVCLVSGLAGGFSWCFNLMVGVIHIYVSLVGVESLVARCECLVFSEGVFCVFWIGWLLAFWALRVLGFLGLLF